MPSRADIAVLAVLLPLLGGCSTIGSHAVRTGGPRVPAYAGPVAIFAAGQAPAGEELGAVEVHGSNDEGDIEELIPVFLDRVAELGGDAAIIDDVHAHFRAFPTSTVTPTVPIGDRPAGEELMTVVIRGRALRTGGYR